MKTRSKLNSQRLADQCPPLGAVDIRRPVLLGDLYEMVGRQRTVWTVKRLVTVPGKGSLAELSQIDGIGRVTVKTIDLAAQIQFKRIISASL
ncbi:hypothetical protein MCP1_400004 [Candidatus Terasakiella magnetica]|nr:hypothetical protein MCP1_400004 [Candidatus Terasakiella magnetica]